MGGRRQLLDYVNQYDLLVALEPNQIELAQAEISGPSPIQTVVAMLKEKFPEMPFEECVKVIQERLRALGHRSFEESAAYSDRLQGLVWSAYTEISRNKKSL